MRAISIQGRSWALAAAVLVLLGLDPCAVPGAAAIFANHLARAIAAVLIHLRDLSQATAAFLLPFSWRRARHALENITDAKNEHRFMAAMDSSLDSFFIFESIRDAAGDIVDFRFAYVNARGAALISRLPEQLIGQALCELMPWHRTEGFFDRYKRVVETGESYVDEFMVGFDEVNATWVKHQCVKFEDGLALTVCDISERKRRAQALAENERRFIAVAESSLDSLFVFQAVRNSDNQIEEFRFVFVNGNAGRLADMVPAEMIGRSFCELMPQNREQGFFDAYKEVVETGAPHVKEFGLAAPDGLSTIWLKIQVVKLDDGVAVTCSDISESKEREIRAAESQRRFLLAAESNVDSFYLLDTLRDAAGEIVDFRFTYINSNAGRLISRTPEEVVGRTLVEIAPEVVPNGLLEKYKAVARTGETYCEELAVDFKGMEAKWLRLQASKLDDGIAIITGDITERKDREQLRAQNERRFIAVADSSLDGIYLLESVRDDSGELVDFRFTFVNGVGAHQLGRESTAIVGHRLCEILPANRPSGLFDEYKRVVATGEPFATQLQVFGFDGVTAEWMKIQTVKLEDGIVLTVSDITDIKRLEAEKRRTFAASLIASLPAAVIVTNVDHIVTNINPAAEKMLWYQPEELINRATPLIFYERSELENRVKQIATDQGIAVSLEQVVFNDGPEMGVQHEAEWTYLRKGGTHVSVQVTVTPLKGDDARITGFMITAYDVSERKRREEYISHLAHHDVLTGLPTRQLLMDRLGMMLSRSQRYSTPSALMMVDLNDFKHINDTLGHHIGDRLLVEVAARLRSAVRSVDTVARMGGDEFVVLAVDLESTADVEIVADKLLAAFHSPFVLSDQHRIDVTASIGACIYPDGGADAGALMRNADVAMYHAKASGQHRYQLFTREIAALNSLQRDLEGLLRNALAENELELFYQPQMAVADGALMGVEALLRWNSKKLGMVSPANFIPVAEQSGLILPIGAWVVQAACRQLRKLHAQFGTNLVMAVNLSPRQLEQSDLLKIIEDALHENEIDPACLEMEITESMLMSDTAKARDFFSGLKKIGVRVAIDDFGTGYSSMSYLLRFSVDRLKIDRCFIQECCSSPNSAALTSTIIALAHRLKVSVVAEGVETQEQLDFLKGADCDEVQGYFLSRPLPAESLTALIAERYTVA